MREGSIFLTRISKLARISKGAWRHEQADRPARVEPGPMGAPVILTVGAVLDAPSVIGTTSPLPAMTTFRQALQHLAPGRGAAVVVGAAGERIVPPKRPGRRRPGVMGLCRGQPRCRKRGGRAGSQQETQEPIGRSRRGSGHGSILSNEHKPLPAQGTPLPGLGSCLPIQPPMHEDARSGADQSRSATGSPRRPRCLRKRGLHELVEVAVENPEGWCFPRPSQVLHQLIGLST